jgi:hypothetical protein
MRQNDIFNVKHIDKLTYISRISRMAYLLRDNQ